MKIFALLLTVLLTFSGCSSMESEGGAQRTEVIGNVTAEQLLAREPGADIFQWEGLVYLNAEEIEWVQEEELEPGDLVGTIQQVYEQNRPFVDGMATVLPEGTEIYESKPHLGPILLAKKGDTYIKYLALIEG